MTCCSQWRVLIGQRAYVTVWKSLIAQSVSTVPVSSPGHTEHICSVKKEYQQDSTIYMIYCQFQMLIIDYCLDMFRASLCPSSGEKTTCYCTWGCLLVVLDVVGCGSVVLRCRV